MKEIKTYSDYCRCIDLKVAKSYELLTKFKSRDPVLYERFKNRREFRKKNLWDKNPYE